MKKTNQTRKVFNIDDSTHSGKIIMNSVKSDTESDVIGESDHSRKVLRRNMLHIKSSCQDNLKR